MPSQVARRIYTDTYTLNTAVGTTPEVLFTAGLTKGVIIIPSGSPITTLTWHAAENVGGTYLPLYNGGTAVTMTVVAGRVYPIPADVLTPTFQKIVANASGSITINYFGA